MKLITLQEWAQSTYSVKFTVTTLNRWARDGLISPSPHKIGNRWLVQPDATYIPPTSRTTESTRTKIAKKELSNFSNVNGMLTEKLLRIVSNGS